MDLPDLIFRKDGDGAILSQDWEVSVALSKSGASITACTTVPSGTVTDGASIPRFLWRLCGHPLQYPRVYAALVHDWLYGGGDRVTRQCADEIYRELLISLGWGRVKAYAEYYALRLFGGSHWHE